tara:strand:- start:28 stop:540 length:513 start_codon:yes stop_codon:yes gene_type:complete
MKPSRKEFIKKAHDNACSEWKTKIEKEFPKLFKHALVVGEWYKTDGFLQIFSGKFGNGSTYGFRRDGVYSASMGFHKFETHIPATDEEVEQALIKEAKKRGFDKGVVADLTFCGHRVSDAKIREESYSYNGRWLSIDNYIIFQEGKWAEIVTETITKEEAEKELGKKIIG